MSGQGIEFVRATREDHFHGSKSFIPVNKRHLVAAGDASNAESKKVKTDQIPLADDGDSAGGLLPKPAFVLVPRARVASMLSWQKASSIGAGLRNLGNTCYLNSVLQCLAYTPPLANFVALQEHLKACSLMKGCSLCDFCRLSADMLKSTGGRLAPNKFCANLRAIAPSFRFGRQEDAHEWLRYLLDSMQQVEERLAAGEAKKLPPHVGETTWLSQMFGGYIANELKCKECGFSSRRSDPVMDLSLEVLGCGSVVDCLRQFTRSEELTGSNAWKCERCDKKQPASKRMMLLRSPLVLTMQLKLFTPLGQKRDKKIQFAKGLDLREFMSDAADKKESQLYSLFAIIVHSGKTTRSGHYTSFVRNSNNVWYHMDDDLVRQVQEQTVLNQSPYVLFYVKNVPTLVHAPPSSVSTQSGVSRQVSVLPPVATVPPAGNAAPPKNAFEVMLSSQKREGPVHAVPLSEQSKKKKKKKKKNKKKKKKDGERIAFVQGKPANANQGVPANVSVSEKSVGPLTEAETIAAAAPTSSSVEKPKDFVEKPKDFVEKPKDFVEKSLEKPVTMELPAAAAESKHNTVGILSEVFSHLKDRAAAAAAAAPFAVPRSKPTTATLVDEKSVSALMQRSQSVADFLAWEETDVATKKIAILQTAVKEKAAARKRESKFDPELDKGKVKKLKSKLKVEESFVPRAAFDSAARHRKLNKSSERPKQQKLKQLKLKFKQKFI